MKQTLLSVTFSVAALVGCANQPQREAADATVYPNAISQPFQGIIPVGDENRRRTAAAVPARQPEELRNTLELKTIYFEFDESRLTDDDMDTIAELSTWMKQNPNSSIRIEGFTDPVGTVAYNKVLGGKRARSFRQALVARGIDTSRVEVVSRGGEPSERKAVVSILAE